MLLFIGGVASILCRARFICFLDSLFFLDFCCVCFLFTLCLSCLCQYVIERRRNRWNVGILFKKVFKMFCLRGDKIVFERRRIYKLFDVSNLKEELVYFCFYICVSYYCLYVFLSTHAVMCSFEWFQERQVHSVQDLLSLLATSRLGVLDWDLWWNWAFYFIGLFLYLSISFCMYVLSRMPKGEIVRF